MPDNDDVESPSLTDAAPTEEQESIDDEQLGSLTVEDDPEGTVDPADLAGTDDGDENRTS